MKKLHFSICTHTYTYITVWGLCFYSNELKWPFKYIKKYNKKIASNDPLVELSSI